MAEQRQPADGNGAESQAALAKQREADMQAAMDRERAAGRTASALGDNDDDDLEQDDFLWVHSNRKDDRVVLAEGHPMHPGGEAFVGGQGVAFVGRSPEVERLLYTGELIEVPEPPKTIKDADGKDIPNPRRPVVAAGRPERLVNDQPGQPTRLARKLDPTIWGADGHEVVREIRKRQARMATQLAVAPGGITPPGMPGTADSARRPAR